MKSCYKLGELIRNVDVKNKDLHCNNLRGLSMTKEFRPSTSNIVGTDLSKYKIVAQKQFACDFMSTIRVHKMPIAFNTGKKEILVSPAYAVFEVVDEKIILPEYLMMWFSRTEFDRYADFRSDAAIRGGFGWNELCETSISIPCITDQYKIVFEYQAITERIALKKRINDNLEAQAEAIYNEMIANNSTNSTMSTLGEISTIKTGKLNSEAAVTNGIYPFFTCSQETYRTNTFSFDQEAVLLAGNNASAIYPLKIYCGKFDVYQRTYVISSNNRFISNKQLYFVLKQQLNEFKGISSGTTTKFLTMKILTPIPVVIAPEDISTSFINITNKMFETIFQNQREIEHLHELQMIVLGELSRN